MNEFELNQVFTTTIAKFCVDEDQYKNLHLHMKPIIYKHRDQLVKSGKIYFGSENKFNADEHGFTSYYGQSLSKIVQFQPIISLLVRELNSFFGKICDYDYKITLDNVWFTIYPKGHSIPLHTHPSSQYSGVYYFDVNEDSGPIYFEDPIFPFKIQFDSGKNPAKPFRHLKEVKVDPQTGMFLIFPSWLPHRTDSNKSDSDRIIFSFNFTVM